MPKRTPPTYFEIWIGRLRCVIELNVPKLGSTFRFETSEYPRRRHVNGHLIRKHFLQRGRWCVSDRISRKEEHDVSLVVIKANAFLQKLILENSSMAHLAVNANIHHESSLSVDWSRVSNRDFAAFPSF